MIFVYMYIISLTASPPPCHVVIWFRVNFCQSFWWNLVHTFFWRVGSSLGSSHVTCPGSSDHVFACGHYQVWNAHQPGVCIYLFMCGGINVHQPSVCIYIYIYMCVCICIYIYAFMFMYVYIYIYTCIYTHTYLYTYTYIYAYVYIYIYIYTFMHIYMYMYVCTYIYIYIYMYI